MVNTILISGGAGFIGSNFVRLMLGRNPNSKIVVFDKLTYSGNRENLEFLDYEFVEGDIADKNAFENAVYEHKPDAIVNFAAETHVDRSIHGGAEEFVRTNVIGVQSILETMRSHPEIKKFVQVSTDEVYGDTPIKSTEIFLETSPLRPSSPYSASKAAGDLLCLAYHRTYGVPVIVTRGSNSYGPYHYPEKIIPFFILRIMEGKKLPVYGDGSNIRDWMHVEDHAKGILTVLEKGKIGEIFNISADQYRSNLEVARAIAEAFGKGDEVIEFVEDRPGHDLRYAPDSLKMLSTLGWKAQIDFDSGLASTIQWFKDNQKWVKNILAKKEKLNEHIK